MNTNTTPGIETSLPLASMVAPFVSDERINEVIVGADFYVFPGTTLTVCCLTLKNGFTVLGESACASAENFDALLGQKYALLKATSKVYELEAYALKERLTTPAAAN
ncbi:Gp49 family protein [Rhodoferax sp.]|uniref:Gp49 family protein n=1 Tax=Rhodoferax sp. TaxID=50421 RepID=UPI0026137F4C|nr:Gp49 family protein [Rhodoferax sp.]MDD5479678.1 Gp49 family protein [Rhodoferax sp.]